MFSSNSAWNWWNFVRNMIMHGCDNPLFYLQIVLQTSFLQVNCFNMSANVVSTIQKWSFVTFEQRFCYNHTWSCPVVAYRKQKTKEYVKFLAQKVVAVVQEIYVVVAYERVFETVFETNKTVIWKVVAYGRWSLMRSGRFRDSGNVKLLFVNSWWDTSPRWPPPSSSYSKTSVFVRPHVNEKPAFWKLSILERRPSKSHGLGSQLTVSRLSHQIFLLPKE